MLPELTEMLRLQELDGEMLKLRKAMASGSARIEQLRKDDVTRQATLARLEQQVSLIAPKRRQLELELSAREQQLAKFRKQVEMVRTPKEAEALTHEVENAETDVARLEDEILQLMEQEEKAQSELKEKRATALRLKTRSAEEQERIHTILKENETLIKGLQEDRAVAASRLSEEIAETYEWLLRKFGPTAVTKLSGEACGGCGGIIVPHLTIRVGLGTELVQCNLCRRYLYSESGGKAQ